MTAWIRTTAAVCCLSVAGAAHGQDSAEDPDSLTTGIAAIRPSAWVLGSAAAGLAAEVLLVHPRKPDVPREGFETGRLWLGIDRASVRPYNNDQDAAGTTMMWATVAYAGLEPVLWGESLGGWSRSLGIQAEVSLLASLASFTLKAAFSRPRPYTYLHAYERNGDGTPNWATSDQAFESLPSGHATIAWASSMSRATLAALRRPRAGDAAHFWSGMAGGVLATSAALLRVEAGTHFPSDAAAGALIGGAVGVAVPLWHAPPLSGGQRRALSRQLWGTVAGAALGLLVTPPTSPFVR